MAERRMFAKSIIDSDVFLDMPLSTQALYFHLSMRADDDGFISNPKKIMRMIGSTQNEIEILLSKRYLLRFDSGIIVIKHWKIHNYIQKDRYKETLYIEEKQSITVKGNKAYTDILYTECIQNGDAGKVRLDKAREDKASLYNGKNNESSGNEKSELDNLITHWNTKANLPRCGLSFNLRNPRQCADAIQGFGVDFIIEAIDNLSKHKDAIGQKYIPDFESLMTRGKLGYWHDWTNGKEEAEELSGEDFIKKLKEGME